MIRIKAHVAFTVANTSCIPGLVYELPDDVVPDLVARRFASVVEPEVDSVSVEEEESSLRTELERMKKDLKAAHGALDIADQGRRELESERDALRGELERVKAERAIADEPPVELVPAETKDEGAPPAETQAAAEVLSQPAAETPAKKRKGKNQ